MGTHLAITIMDSYPGAASADSNCNFGFDITKGELLEATVVASVDDLAICYQAVPTYAPMGSWTWTLQESATEAQGAGVDLLLNVPRTAA